MNEIIRRLMENHHLNEMALSQSDAIGRCMSLGKEFLEHFHKVFISGKDAEDYSHHCHEMQVWYDSISDIRLNHNKKPLSNVQKMDWFFTAGANVEDSLHVEKEIELYNTFIIKILSEDKKIKEILPEILEGI